jgi:hypothetical protein
VRLPLSEPLWPIAPEASRKMSCAKRAMHFQGGN